MSYVPPHKRNQIIEESEKANGTQNEHSEDNRRIGRRWADAPDQSKERNFGDAPRGYDERRPYDDRRGGYDDRRSYDDRRGGYDDRRFNNFSRGPRNDRQVGGRWQNDEFRRERSERSNKALEEELFNNAIETGINFDKYNDIPVEVDGKDVPELITSFDESQLAEKLLQNIERAKYTTPTPVQKYSIPIALKKRDLMACAQTGSGKTGGFLFPIIHTLLEDGSSSQERNPRGYRGSNEPTLPDTLILSPTRELTTQIYNEARKFTFDTGLRAVVVYGGAPIRRQIDELRRGCNILVATPGRLVDLITQGVVGLERIRFFVLDEADNMLDMGFEPQIRQIVEEEGLPPKSERQTMMFSATFPSEIQRLASHFLNDYIHLKVGRVGSTTDLITQTVIYVEDQDKIPALLDCIQKRDAGLTLVFTKTKRDCDAVEYELGLLNISCESIHGDRQQSERERALSRFKEGRASVLVATDVAARGLNIPNVTHVINFDMPENIDSYIHRIGRTGRAGNEGLATSFYNRSNSMVICDLIEVLEETNQIVPDWMKEERALYERTKMSRKRPGKGYVGGNKGYAPRGGPSRPSGSWSSGGGSRGFGGGSGSGGGGFGSRGWGSSGF